MEDQEKRESNVCPVLTREEIRSYSEIAVSTQLEMDLDLIYLESLKRLGRDLKEIQANLEDHLGNCSTCKQHYNYEYETRIKIFRTMKSAMLPVFERRTEGEKSFKIDHMLYEKQEDLRSYIYERVLVEVAGRDFPINQEFEKHIKDCDSCKKYYQVELASMEENQRTYGEEIERWRNQFGQDAE